MIIVLDDLRYASLFMDLDEDVKYYGKGLIPRVSLPHEVVSGKIDQVNLIVFGGGTDVNPLYYGQKRLPNTDHPDRERDAYEAIWFSFGRINNIPMAGICRGSQFGCVMSGGELYQDVSHHALHGKHPMHTIDNNIINVNSTHHQMMCPDNTEHELIGWADKLSQFYKWDNSKDVNMNKPEKEAEMVYFVDTKFLSCQYHPEILDEQDPARLYYIAKLREYFPNLAHI